MASKKELRALITLAGKIDPSLQSALMKASKLSANFSNQSKKAGTSLSKIGTIAKGVFIGDLAAKGVVSLGQKLIETGKSGIQLASDLAEVQNVVDTTFGKNSSVINDWSKKALNAYGLSELSAKQYNGTLGAMMKSSGLAGDQVVKMSQKLTGLAGDFSSFYNLSQDDAFEKIRSGISGETEPLKQLGINMSVANLQAYALSKGIKTSYEKMDQASQTALRYSYLMSVSKDAQGDFAKTQGGFANQQRLLTTNMQQFAATIGQTVLPYLTKLFQKSNEFMQNTDAAAVAAKISGAFSALGNEIKFVKDHAEVFIPIVSGLTGALIAYELSTYRVVAAEKAGMIISALSKAWGVAQMSILLLQSGTSVMALAQMGLNAAFAACPVGFVVAGIGLLIAAGVALYKNWDTVSASAGRLWSGIKSAFAGGVNWVIGKINSLIDIINKIPGIEIPKFNLVDGTTAMSGNAVAMNKFASGGIANKPSIFGEAGSEMAIPLKRSTRSLGLLSQTADILGVKSANGSYYIELVYSPQIYGGDKADIISILLRHSKELKDELRALLEDLLNEEGRVSLG